MPQPTLDQAWLQIAVGLSTSMPGELQYQRLVQAICDVLPCDAVSLMQLNEGELVPVAAMGLAPELIGQRARRASASADNSAIPRPCAFSG